MFEHGLARAGYIDVPRDRDLAFEFLPTKWRTIQHYGVEIGGRRYGGAGLPEPGTRSPYQGRVKNGWPFQIDPDDVSRIYFRDPASRIWRALTWEHESSARMPLSEDALGFARKLAAAKYRYPDDRLAVADLLERWNLGLGTTLAERRMALRLSREQAAIDLPETDAETPVSRLSVQQALGDREASTEFEVNVNEPVAEAGDDDNADLDDPENEDGFYAEALEDA
ncbi:hypothetical protein ACIP69_12125 [Streptomyces hygroscopicus]|uniref:hypothetical protein n=1 Tax=Streptomyces hygroscopicus TaxID=1912 RepID=UPI00382B85D7